MPPGEKINFNNALGIEYDKGNWKLEDGLQEYVEILLKQKNLSDEMRVLMIFEKICKDYVYDDNLISYIKKLMMMSFAFQIGMEEMLIKIGKEIEKHITEGYVSNFQDILQ